jgi:hypothetical protein
MYATCLFCNHALGRNEVLETFPVGRRLAFDAAKGRLWVVCRKCERWNLSPLEERWEAFEACERLFRETRLRMSTDNIGLARLREGLELVRIGEPLRPEFAAWRYGDQFGRRRRRAMLLTGAAVAAGASLMIGAAAAGVSVGAFGGLWNTLANAPVRARLRLPDGRIKKVRNSDLETVRLFRDRDAGGWLLTIRDRKVDVSFRGSDAERAAGILLPAANLWAGSRAVVREAVDVIQAAGHPEAFLEHAGAGFVVPTGHKGTDKQAALKKLPAPTRLALEMALHEEQERRALAGELVELELAWRQAEEIAAIADNLLVPPEHEARIAAERERQRQGPGSADAEKR